MSKDYYRILGVLDDAEDIVIRAAYKALAQRYHPDKWTGNKDEANKRMSEINEAYGVLSDSVKRKQYDATRENKGYQEDDEPDDEKDFKGDINSEEEKAWQLALEFFPELKFFHNKLSQLNYRLANTYKTYLIENKNFNEAQTIANKYSNAFLERYFGKNQIIREYAEFLILRKHKDAARKLNEIVNVMGKSVSAAQIKSLIEKEFKLTEFSANYQEVDTSLMAVIQRVRNHTGSSGDLIHLTEMVITGKVQKNVGLISNAYEFIWNDNKVMNLDFQNFYVFVMQKVLPLVEKQ
jgi:curved DNA-binding protein CbpA